MPDDAVAGHIAKSRLIRVLEDWCQPCTGYHLYDPNHRQSSGALAVIVEALRYQAPSPKPGKTAAAKRRPAP